MTPGGSTGTRRLPGHRRGRLVLVTSLALVAVGAVLLLVPAHGRATEPRDRRVACGSAFPAFFADDPAIKLNNLAALAERTPAREESRVTPELVELVEDVSSHRSCVTDARRFVVPAAVLVLAGLAGALASGLVARGRASSSVLSRLSSPVPFGLAVGVLAVAGLAVRVFYVGISARHLVLGYDADYYAQGWDRWSAGPTALFPPVWTMVVGTADALGLDAKAEKMLVGCVVGAATVVLVGFLGRRVGGPAVGLVAAGMAVAWPFLVAADGSLMSESLYVALVVVVVLLVPLGEEPASVRRWAVVGAAIGLAALTRGEAVLLLPVLVVPLALRHRAGGLRRPLALIGVAALAAGLVVLPWMIRNGFVLDEPVLLSNNFSTVIAGANCEEAYAGSTKGFWVVECLQRHYTSGELSGATPLAETAANNRARRAGLRYATSHASELPEVAAVRLLRTWGLYRPHAQMRIEASVEVRSYEWLRWGRRSSFVVLPFAAWGAWQLWRRRSPALLPLGSLVVMVSITSVLTYGIQRFRLAAEPALLVLAAVGVVSLVRVVGFRGSPDRPGPAVPTPSHR